MATPLSAARLLAALKAEGLTVHEHPGWRTHNRDTATGKTFGPVYGVLIHHTAGRNDRELCYNGRPGLPGPLCHSWLGKTAGLWMLGHGRANHAGLVDLDVVNALRAEKSPLPRDDQANADGNDLLYGLEIENLGNGKDPYPEAQYRQAVLWAAAICRAHGWTERSIAGHKEVQPGKVDPSFDMNVFRADVKKQLATKPGTPVVPPPAPSRPKVDLSRLVTAARTDPPKAGTPVSYAAVNVVENALVKEGLLVKAFADGHFGTATRDAYARWQRHLGYSGSAADGIPGMTSLKRLGDKYGFSVVA